jgi:hypothetical protein
MRRLILSLFTAAVALGATPAVARDAVARFDEKAPPEAVARFLMGTRLGYITCSGKYRSYLEKRDLYDLVADGKASARLEMPSPEEATACVHETMYKGKSLYDAAARQAPAQAGKTALREYMTAWEASLTALQPKQPEKPREFESRHRKQEARLDELQKRVETTTR